MKAKIYLWLGIFSVLLTLGCRQTQEQHPTIEELIDEAVARRLKEYRETRERNCRKKIMEHAHDLADSMLIARVKDLMLEDTVLRPERLNRPFRPETRPPRDTSPPVPLLPLDSLLQDTIELESEN